MSSQPAGTRHETERGGLVASEKFSVNVPYRALYINALNPPRLVGEVYEMYTSDLGLEPIMAESIDAWEAVAPVLDAHLIARLEFFWDDANAHRGVVLFDNNQQAVVHVANALLGYGGNGPLLSRQILIALGMSADEFDKINRSVWNQHPYTLTVTREATSTVRTTTYATDDIVEYWTFW